MSCILTIILLLSYLIQAKSNIIKTISFGGDGGRSYEISNVNNEYIKKICTSSSVKYGFIGKLDISYSKEIFSFGSDYVGQDKEFFKKKCHKLKKKILKIEGNLL
jgi:hypothetical protein